MAATDNIGTLPEARTHDSKLDDALFVVGIGASAGGLEALEHFFRAIPADSGMAFVVIQHLSPDFKSLMDELLGRYTKMTIVRVAGPTELHANTIYLLPPRKEMLMEGGRLVVVDRLAEHHLPSMPINRFFRSLAREKSEKAIGIVLSGTGSDGSMGVSDIYNVGGLVLVQSEASSKFDGMPRSAIATGCAHAVLAPEEMPALLLKYIEDPASLRSGSPGKRIENDEDLAGLFERILDAYGIDFSLYKPATIKRRIERRVVLGNFDSVKSYCDTVFRDSGELELLYKDLLIGVTRFFRDPEAFHVMREKVIPEVVAAAAAEDDIRVWVPGCATGEEAYSLAILFLEELDRLERPSNLKVFATDQHRNSLRIAAEGLYPEASLEVVPEPLREKYFRREANGSYRVLPRLRKVLLVSPHNLIRDVPFNRIDLVSCRNLLIYFQPVAQTKALTAFHFALKLKGFLFLGPSESTGDLEQDFETTDRTWKIFRKTSEVRLPLDLRKPLITTPPPARVSPTNDARLTRIYDQLLGRYMPPGFLVNEKRELIHVFGRAKQFLHPPEGRSTQDVIAMCDGDLRVALSSLIQACLKRRERVEMPKVHIRSADANLLARVVAEPVSDKVSSMNFILLHFTDESPVVAASAAPTEKLELGDGMSDHMQNLEEELKDTRESLQAMVEELETTNEELQASNEELLASNEELQSTNEELHSVNEELYSVNAEHEQKIRELATTTSDLRNLMAESHSGIIFTDRRQHVRMFTPGAALLLNLLPQDVGRPIAHITPRIQDDRIFEDISKVEQTRRAMEREVMAPDGRRYLRRIAPYDDVDKQPAGLVIAFIDISELLRAQQQARRLAAIVESSDDAIIGMDLDGLVTTWNAAATRMFGFALDEAVGVRLAQLILAPGHGDEPDLLQKIATDQAAVHFETVRRCKDGGTIDVSETFSRTRDSSNRVIGASLISRDISERRRTDAELKRSLRELAELKAALDEHAIVAITNPQGKITYVNDKFCTISKFKREELLGQDHRIVNSGYHSKEFMHALWSTVGKGRVWHGIVKNKAKDGTFYWVDTTIVPFLNEKGKPRQYVVIRADITGLIEVEEKLTVSVQEKEVLLKEIHHRVKNNLQVVASILQLQSAKLKDAKYREMFAECQNRVQSMAMIHERLYGSRNLGAINFAEHAQSLASMILRSYGHSAKKVHLEVIAESLTVDIDKAIPASLMLNEMISNAMKHAFPKGRSGRITVTFRAEDEDRLSLAVRDDGVGFPKDVDAKDAPSLGLSMIKGLARQLRGQIQVSHENGTCFQVIFPANNVHH